jgi:hypothetical protein
VVTPLFALVALSGKATRGFSPTERFGTLPQGQKAVQMQTFVATFVQKRVYIELRTLKAYTSGMHI